MADTKTQDLTRPASQSHEPLLTFAQAARLPWLPSRRHGKRPSVPTFWRWATHGCYGVRLKVTSVGSTLCVTEQDLRDFFAAISRQRGLIR